jgi:hypothetical protein
MKSFNLLLKHFASRIRLVVLFLSIISSQIIAQQTDLKGPAGSEQFGKTTTVLPNGNFVVTDPYYDEGAITNVGAVYLYNGNTLAVISVLKGSKTGDNVGSSGIKVLSNGNYVVVSSSWDGPSAANVGAVTYCNAVTGLSGVVSSTNSLVGTKADDGSGISVDTLSNGNYVVRNYTWDNGAITNAGAVTWCNGITGRTGSISTANSLVGSKNSDRVGNGSIYELSNGNYLVRSIYWGSSTAFFVGAVTWCNGATGRIGTVSSSNSLVGTHLNDQVGRIIVLNNGNYVVNSHYWDNGTIADAGAVTWCNGSTGATVGEISSANSLVGTVSGEMLGNDGVYALSSGNYIVNNEIWKNGTATSAGAVTWCNGVTGTSGFQSSANSLVGSTTDDLVGGGPAGATIVLLTNGNYLVVSNYWDNGTKTDAGAVTWCDGTTGKTGTVSAANSLVGSTAYDGVGRGSGISVLSNGNYVVNSPYWDKGAITDVGAATWCNGTTGRTGTINSSNSLVGSTTNDNVGNTSSIALSNGNYVVTSPSWDKGAVTDVGAATWCNGATGTIGLVSTANSLVGSTTGDNVGTWAAPLTNGNYVIGSPQWDNATFTEAGAVTWGNGSEGTSAVVSSSNSLVGTTTNCRLGSNISSFVELKNSDYMIMVYNWLSPAALSIGAVIRCNGSTGTSGVINSSNSLTGSKNGDLTNIALTALNNGGYVIKSPAWDNGALNAAGAVTLGDSLGVFGTIKPCNSVTGGTASQGASMSFQYNYVYDYLVVSHYYDTTVSIFRPQMSIANSLDTVSADITSNNFIRLIVKANCNVIAGIQPTGANPVAGAVKASVWIEPSVPTYADQPYVARHFEITPAVNASSATGRITLYFTQQEFDNFNAHPGSSLNLPTNAADDDGKSFLRIGKFSGTSSNGTGLPETYGGSSFIDPADSDIIWNEVTQVWEVSFDVTGFSSFIVLTNTSVLPVSLLEFTGRLQNNNGFLHWKTANENALNNFIVERSIDGKIFDAIGSVNATGNVGNNVYSFTDVAIESLGSSYIYYRLKQMDFTGRYSYSNVVIIAVGNKNMLLLYPNPVGDKANITITLAKGELVQLKIIDNTGRIVQQEQINLKTGSTSMPLNVSQFAKGIYCIEVKGTIFNQRKQFIKQ